MRLIRLAAASSATRCSIASVPSTPSSATTRRPTGDRRLADIKGSDHDCGFPGGMHICDTVLIGPFARYRARRRRKDIGNDLVGTQHAKTIGFDRCNYRAQ